jgi:hypothetical protein
MFVDRLAYARDADAAIQRLASLGNSVPSGTPEGFIGSVPPPPLLVARP